MASTWSQIKTDWLKLMQFAFFCTEYNSLWVFDKNKKIRGILNS
jgi:hypothetical protein